MLITENNFKNGLNFLIISLYAFGSLALDVLLCFIIEPKIFGTSFRNFTNLEYIVSNITTSIVWGVASYLLIRKAKRKYDYDIFAHKESIGLRNWILCILLLAITVSLSYMDWNGFKVTIEFQNKGLGRFIFQYIYYAFETVLFLLVIIFSQEAGERWFNKKIIPWGGIFVALTWGLSHALSKGQLYVGIGVAILGFIYGVQYIICKKNLYIAFPLIFLMFIL